MKTSDADLLIHEAYGPAGDTGQAHAFGHSTAAEAGEIALADGAKRLVLSQIRASRFADPDTLAIEAAYGSPVEVARDLDAFDF